MLAKFLIAVLPFLAASTFGQGFRPDRGIADDIKPSQVIHWTINQAIIDRDGVLEVGLTLSTSRNFTIYRDKLHLIAPPGYKLVDMKLPDSTEQTDPVSGSQVQVFTAGEFFYYFTPTGKSASKERVDFQLTYTGCTDVICLFPYTERFRSAVFITTERHTLPSQNAAAKQDLNGNDEQSLSESLTRQISQGGLSLPLLLLFIFLGGVLTNLTPCVYPMIPITLRLLGGQSQRAFLNSSIYASGILITYTGLGVFAASTGGMFGALLQSKAVNVFFALVMFILGFTMLGFGNFSKLQTLGDRLGAGKPSLKNMFLMGVGAGFVASPCTGPVLGALLTLTLESQDLTRGMLMMFTYSFGFAVPYVFLGGAAAKVSQVKLAPKWQFLTKLVFAAIMFGLCLYYLRVPFYSELKLIKPYWTPIATGFGSLATVLIFIWLASPALQIRKTLTLFPAMITGVAVFAAVQQLSSAPVSQGELVWHKSEDSGYKAARASGKPIIIDGWAEWCEACKKMEATTFKDPDLVKELASHWTLIKLDLTEDSEANDKIIEKYGMPGLPTMILLPANGELAKKHKIVGEKSARYFLKELRDYRTNL